eukprot:6442113-Pyramimonas_sp.AAC.1
MCIRTASALHRLSRCFSAHLQTLVRSSAGAPPGFFIVLPELPYNLFRVSPRLSKGHFFRGSAAALLRTIQRLVRRPFEALQKLFISVSGALLKKGPP